MLWPAWRCHSISTSGAFSRADYDDVVDYLAPLEHLVKAVPPDENGLRWRYVDGSVLFHYSKVLPVDFDRFVEAVPVRNAITWMKDYIGGQTVPVQRDREGRVTHQAERNVYLPQPNWLVLYGGSVIDVAKLESIRYDDDEHKIVWRTVHSSNDSATHDDGSVRFTQRPCGYRGHRRRPPAVPAPAVLADGQSRPVPRDQEPLRCDGVLQVLRRDDRQLRTGLFGRGRTDRSCLGPALR